MVGGRNSTSRSFPRPNSQSGGRGECPFVALPVFPSRVLPPRLHFHQHAVRHPRAEGPRGQAHRRAALYPRPRRSGRGATSRNQLHVDLASRSLVQGAWKSRVARQGRMRRRCSNRPGSREHKREPLGALLGARRDRRVDRLAQARTSSAVIPRSPGVPQLPHTRARALRAGRIFPIMHLIAIRRELYERHRWIATALQNAFVERSAGPGLA